MIRCLLALCVTSLILLISAPPANAQLSKRVPFQIDLKDTEGSVAIGPNIYMTEQSAPHITYDFIARRLDDNIRGDRQNQEVINLGFTKNPVWMVFTVANNTKEENWVLKFGNLFNGRYGAVKNLVVFDHTNQRSFIDTLQNKDIPSKLKPFIENASIPVTIQPGKTSVFVVYLQATTPLLSSFSPRLMTRDSLLINLNSVHKYSVFLYIAIILIGGFFLAVAFLKRDMSYILFSAFFIYILLGLYTLQNTFYSNLGVMSGTVILWLCLAVASGLALTLFFFGTNKDDDPVQFKTLSIVGIALCIFGLCNLIPGSHIMTQVLTLFVIFGGCALILFHSILNMQDGKFGSPYYATGWGVFTLALLATGAALYGKIPANVLTVNILWVLLFVQALFFVLATLQKIRLLDEQQRQLQVREHRQIYNVERLKQSKKSADQARLLRVIEREREVMADLRERERQRGEEMRAAKEAADIANEAKSAFLAMVSHEIRTPMTGLMGMIRLLLDTKMSAKQNDYLNAMQKSGDTMMALLNDILDFEKIESGNMKLENISFDLLKLVNGVVTLMSAYADEKDIFVRADIDKNAPQYVTGDPTRLRQVFLNLISNAIKFTDQGGVTLYVHATKLPPMEHTNQQHYEIYFGIEDSGIGISQAAQDKLFIPFAQAEASTTRHYGGTGLGLAICKNLIENMNSSIQVQSEAGNGSTFFFTLVMPEGDAEQSDDDNGLPSKNQRQADRPQKILIIEDNQINRRVMYGLIEKYGHLPSAIASGEEAVSKLSEEDFDLIFTDINLQGMSGIETAKTIRSMANRKKARTPIIALTGNVRQIDIDSYYAAQINGYLSKPINPKLLSEIIVNASEGNFANPLPPDATREETISSQEEVNLAETLPESTDQTNSEEITQDVIILPPPPIRPEEIRFDMDNKAKTDMNKDDHDIHTDSQNYTYDDDEEDSFAIHTQSHDLNEKTDLEKFISGEITQNTNDEVSDVGQDSQNIEPPSELIHLEMMQDLFNTLGKDQTNSLFIDYYKFADSIIETLQEEIQTKNMQNIIDRAHELKGMAANFGFTEVSRIAANIERISKDGDVETTLPFIEALPKANQESQEAAQEWLASQ